ncbi:hypothetical protein GCM10027346_05940 [Hymenobacter seoulensis]
MKKTLLLFFAGSLLMAGNVKAQWVKQRFSFSVDSNVALYTDAIDNNTAWALSNRFLSRASANEVAKTFDGGQNWTVFPVTGVDPQTEIIQSLSAVSATTAWVVTLPISIGPGRILKTTNGGSTWTVQTDKLFIGEYSYANTIHFFNANDGVVLGDPDGLNGGGMEIYYTSDGGTTWTRSQNVPIGTEGEFGTLYPPAVFGNSIWIANDEGDIFRSTDKGVTWSVTRDVAPDPIENLAFRDAQNGLALVSDTSGTKHKLFGTSDGGVTWASKTYSGPLRGFGLTSVPGTGNYLSVGALESTGDIGSSYSRDNGQTWLNIESNTLHLFVDAAGPTAVWSGTLNPDNGYGDGVNKLVSTVLPNRTATLVAGATLVPNPSADGRFELQWPSAAHQGEAVLTVTDALGRQVIRQQLNASQLKQTNLNLGQQKAGIYEVKLESKAGVSHLRAQVL